MTWNRFIARNRLAKGNYGDAGDHKANVNIDPDKQMVTTDDFYIQLGPHYVERLKRYEGQYTLLLGDLRRLEEDMLDEMAICDRISRDTGIEKDIVAAVLQSFTNV